MSKWNEKCDTQDCDTDESLPVHHGPQYSECVVHRAEHEIVIARRGSQGFGL
jgi:hypothetical protein